MSDETLLRWIEDDPKSAPLVNDYDQWEAIRDARTEAILRRLEQLRQTELFN